MKTISCKEVLKTQYGQLQTIEHELRSTGPKLLPLLQWDASTRGVTSDWRSAWPKGLPNVKLTWHSTTLGQWMPLLGTSDQHDDICSQPASQQQLASQPAIWQDINLSGFGLVRYLVAAGLGTWPHWAPVQGPSTPTGSPWGVTYLTKPSQVTEISSTVSYIPFKLHLVTICSFVSTLSNHIFLCTT